MAKPIVIPGIECDSFAAEAIRLVARSRLKEMFDLRIAALDWVDPEGVHDMRVASRRLRGALSDFTPYLRKRFLNQSLKEIKSIADALGAVRDQDVAIRALERLAKKTRADVSEELDKVVEERNEVRDKARKELIRVLRKGQLRLLEYDFSKAIDAATEGPKRRKINANDATSLSYRAIARSIILERLKELEKLSDSLYHPLEIEPLHKMRIAAKRLRYAVELFEQCWGSSISIFAKRAEDLQSTLGDLHDCDVWIENFGERLSKATKGSKTQAGASSVASVEAFFPLSASSTSEGVPAGAADNASADSSTGDSTDSKDASSDSCVDASAWLLRHFMKLRSKHFHNALCRWREWEDNAVSSELKKLLRSHEVISTTARKRVVPKTE